MNVELKLNLTGWEGIESKLKDLHTIKGVQLQWTLHILNQYAEIVEQAMGSISAHGGYLRISFQGVDGKPAYWKNLTPYTLAVKAIRAGKTLPRGPTPLSTSQAVYDHFASEFRIWKDSGLTKDAVDVTGNFAGIASGQSEALYRATRVELGVPGEKIPPRRLFSVANEMFVEALRKAFGADGTADSKLANDLRAEIIEHIQWGKKL